MSEMRHFEGTCDVCGEPISLDWDMTQGVIDYLIEDNLMVTWVRHYATAPPEANPECAIYSSRVYEVVDNQQQKMVNVIAVGLSCFILAIFVGAIIRLGMWVL